LSLITETYLEGLDAYSNPPYVTLENAMYANILAKAMELDDA